MKDIISSDKIKSQIKTEFIGHKIYCYDCVDSTNLTAKENQTEPEGTVFIANHQLKGRGRLQREWSSESSSGIYMSILLKPSLPPEEFSLITLLAGLSVTVALNKISGKQSFIKWPNDCIISGKKVSGILTELSVSDTNNVIVGIGINVNNSSFPADLKDKATSLYMENHYKYDRCEIIGNVLSEFEKYYNKFLKNGFSSLIDEYSKLCITSGREVEIITPSENYKAKAIGVDSSGKLLIEKDGKTEAIGSGEVSVRGILGYV